MGDRIDVDSTQNIISFCTGYGGIESGIRRAGVDVRTVVNVEIEAFCCANLAAKIEEGLMDDAPIYTDLKTFPAEIFRGKVHGIIGGYPCQPFSSAGKRQGEKDPRHLWPYIRSHVRAVRPLWCFFENVRGHTTMGLWRVLSDLEEDGYRTEFGLYSAEETGAPHQRIRCFILAKLPDTNLTGLEGKTSERVQGRDGRGEQYEVCESTTPGGQNIQKQLGDTKHDGLHGDSFSGGSGEDRERSEKGKKASEQSEGASGQEDLRHLQPTELAHTASREPRQSQARNGGQDTSGGSEEELADSEGNDEQRCDTRQGEMQLGRGCSRHGESTRWPARPGEEQYEWEEPRVTEAQSELGGAVDGLTHRVDRLRLLGNGVVPQTAELAWKSLWRKMNEDNNY